MTDSKPLMNWCDESNENNETVVRRATKEKMKTESKEDSSIRKRVKHNSKSDSDDGKNGRPPRKPLELETSPSVLQRRQKQIDYGKNTVGYHNFSLQVPVDQRSKEHPKTPDKYAKYSRRSWDTLIKIWRKKLHEYDTNATNDNISDNESNEEDQ